MSDKYETYGTDEIVCPYCGHEFSDSNELNGSSGRIIDCDVCAKKFTLEVDFAVSYTTTVIEEKI